MRTVAARFLCVVVAAAASAQIFAAEEVYIGQLLDDPMSLHGKRVAVVGLAYIDKNQIYLVEDVAAARKLDAKHAVFVRAKGSEPLPDEYHRFWIRLTGIVDAEAHGRWGDNPCEMQFESLEPLSREAKAKLWRTDIGKFRNATGLTILIEIDGPTGTYCNGPWDSDEVAILSISSGRFSVKEWTGKESKEFLTTNITIPKRNNRNDEPDDREFHYVIYRDRIEMEPVINPIAPPKKSKKAKP